MDMNMKRGMKWAVAVTLGLVLVTGCQSRVEPKPKLEFWVPPGYPDIAVSHQLKGAVTVQCDVGSDGLIHNAKVIKSTPAGVFDAYVLQSLKLWRYERNKPVNGMIKNVLFTPKEP